MKWGTKPDNWGHDRRRIRIPSHWGKDPRRGRAWQSLPRVRIAPASAPASIPKMVPKPKTITVKRPRPAAPTVKITIPRSFQKRTRGRPSLKAKPPVESASITDEAQSWIDTVARAVRSRSGAFAAADWLPSERLITERIVRLKSFDLTLYDFQKIGVEYLTNQARALLLDGCGVGKTVQCIVSLPQPHRAGVQIVVPPSMVGKWTKELRKWADKDWSIRTLSSRYEWLWPKVGEIVVVAWSQIPKILDPNNPLKEFPKPNHNILTVADEAHRGKGKSTAAGRSIRALMRMSDGAWAMTATAMANDPQDFWQLARMVSMEKYLARDLKHYRTWFKMEGKKVASVSPAFQKVVELISLRRTKDQVLAELPPVHHEVLNVKVSSDSLVAQSKYLRLIDESEIISKLTETGMSQEERLEEWKYLACAVKLCNEAKMPYVLDWIAEREAAGEPCVVFCTTRSVIDELEQRPGWLAIHGGTKKKEREGIVERFQDPEQKIKGIAITSAAAEGVTLTRAFKMLRVNRDWAPWLNAQVKDRINRIGQKNETTITDLFAVDCSIDSIVREVVRRKIKYQRGSGLLT